jgi:hypothetical protein
VLLLTTRVILLVDAPKILAVHMGVDLRGRYVGVTQHVLNRPQVGAALQEMSGK